MQTIKLLLFHSSRTICKKKASSLLLRNVYKDEKNLLISLFPISFSYDAINFLLYSQFTISRTYRIPQKHMIASKPRTAVRRQKWS